MSRTTLDARLEHVEQAIELGRGRIDDDQIAELEQLIARAGERRALSGDHTVVGFFGATGSGKSSLFNAVVGQDLARVHARRPTTSEPLAAVWGVRDSEPLLDWLDVRDRRPVEEAFNNDPNLSLILLDLPDFDSIALEHRAIVERLVGQVDVLVWVVDPQKYADQTIHNDFIRPLARHAAVTACVLNQVDRLPKHEVPRVVASLEELLRADGLGKVRILPASAKTGEGIPAVRQMIARFATTKLANSQRLAADIDAAIDRMEPSAALTKLSSQRTDDMVRQIAAAAGTREVADAVAASYRHRAGVTTGWPLTSWIRRLRPDPLKRLHLTQNASRDARKDGRDANVHRTSLPPLTAGQQAGINRSVRAYADDASRGLDEGWQQSIRAIANDALEGLPGELDRAIANTSLGARGSWWWPVVAVIQWLALLAALGGVLWYLAAWLLPLWGFPAPEIIMEQGWPVPGLLIAAGLLTGIVLGLMSSVFGAAISSMRRSRARKRLLASVGDVVDAKVVRPIQDERQRAVSYQRELKAAAGR